MSAYISHGLWDVRGECMSIRVLKQLCCALYIQVNTTHNAFFIYNESTNLKNKEKKPRQNETRNKTQLLYRLSQWLIIATTTNGSYYE